MNPFERFRRNPFAQFARGGPEVVATTDDGGRVTRGPDGALSFASPGYATNDQARIAEIMKGANPVNLVQGDLDRERIAANPVAARVQEFNQGAPIVGEWLDEGVGMVAPQAAENMRKMSDAMERQHPGQSTALNIAGGLGYGGALLTAAPQYAAPAANWIGNASTRLGTGLRAGAVAVPAGAMEGSAAFSGRADNGNRVSKGIKGGAVGGMLAGVIGTFAPLAVEGVTNLARRVKKLDVKTIASELGISENSARVVRKALMNDDLNAASLALKRGGDDAMLAEAGPATRNLLDSGMQTGGEALRVGRNAVSGRMRKQGEQFNTALNTILGTAEGGIKAASKQISQRTKTTRDAAYNYAYKQPTPMTGPAGQGIQAALDRIDPPVLNAAVKKANAMMRDKGLRNLNIMASIDPATGEVVFSQPLSVAQLDYIGRGLGQLVDDGTDKLSGQMTSEAAMASGQAKALRDAMKMKDASGAEAIPGYARALKLGGDNIANKNALVMGRRLLSTADTVEDVRTAMHGASKEVLAAARKGLRENIEAVMGRARSTIADLESGNFDFDTGVNAVGEAVAAFRNMVNGDTYKKATYVLGGDAKKLFDELRRTGDALVLRAAVARNSATAIRQATQEEMKAVAQPGLTRRVLGEAAVPWEAAREGTRALAGTDAATMANMTAEHWTEIAKTLTRLKGDDARRALIVVRQAMRGQPVKDADAALLGRVLGVNAGNLAYQGARQSLTPR